MRALVCQEYRGIDSLQVGELPRPEPAPGYALIEVAAAAVNFADILVVSGQYQMKPDLPFAPGSEAAGTVVDTGGIAGLSLGDEIAGFVGFGAMAEYASIPGHGVMALDGSVSLDEGATLPVAYGTAYHALVDRGELEQGETLLVLGASGGVGLAAVQVGKRLGARVVAAVSSDFKAETARSGGADEVIRYDQIGLREGIDETTGGNGVDVVFDPVGGDFTEQALRSTRWGGRLLVIGFAAGTIPSVPINLTLVKGNSIVGVFWGRHFQEDPEAEAANLRTVMEWVKEGSLRPHVQRSFPLEDATAALRWVGDRKVIGRVVINP